MQLNHSMHSHALDHIVEVSLVVIDGAPAKAPAGQAVDFGDGTGADDWNSRCRIAKRDKGAFGVVGQPVVNLVGDYGHLDVVSHS